MKTEIFEDYQAFRKREDKKVNGVSKEFAENYPNFAEQNITNEGCWNCSDCSDCSSCRYCSDCSDCSSCSSCRYCSDCSDCSSCRYCSSCSDCSDCSSCRYCRYCSDCSSCSDCSDKVGQAKPAEGETQTPQPGTFSEKTIPVIENIHQKVFEAASAENALNMGEWHTKEVVDETTGAHCGTTHCRAGWVVTLAGAEGRKLELLTSTAFAAQMIYKHSSPIKVGVNKFFVDNDAALADMKECAEKEAALPKTGSGC